MKDNISSSAKISHQGKNIEFGNNGSQALLSLSITQGAGENFRFLSPTHRSPVSVNLE